MKCKHVFFHSACNQIIGIIQFHVIFSILHVSLLGLWLMPNFLFILYYQEMVILLLLLAACLDLVPTCLVMMMTNNPIICI